MFRVRIAPNGVTGPSRRSVVHNSPPSRLDTFDPGSVRTRTSNVDPFGDPGGITPSTITTATAGSRSTSRGVFPASGPSRSGPPRPIPPRASSRSIVAWICTGNGPPPVPLSPTTIPKPETRIGSIPRIETSEPTVPRSTAGISRTTGSTRRALGVSSHPTPVQAATPIANIAPIKDLRIGPDS